MRRQLSFKSKINCSQEELFDWHERPGAFERLTPYWEPVEVFEASNSIKDGSEVKLAVKMGPIAIPWHLRHEDYKYGEQFCDLQLQGPFAYWRHDHLMQGSELEDRVEFKLPLGFLGDIFGFPFVKQKLTRLFAYRHRITQADINARNLIKGEFEEVKKMKILISGATGLVGGDLKSFLSHNGHEVHTLTRDKAKADEHNIFWDPMAGILDSSKLEGYDAVIHLSGENIAAKRWSEKQKAKIKDSRVKSTTLLSEALAKLQNPPKTFICASAIGYYANRPGEVLTEESSPVPGDFMSETCLAWENACQPARDKGIRVVNARFGVVLSPRGGMLAKILPIFILGGGGIIGNGKQEMSWIALDDVIYGLNFCLHKEEISGPVNFTAPKVDTNGSFTWNLSKTLWRPAIFPVPSFAAKLAFGEMADALLLASSNVKPGKLQKHGYKFAYPDSERALAHLLGR